MVQFIKTFRRFRIMKSQLEICKILLISAVESGRYGAKMPFELWNTWRDSNINCWNAAGNNGKEMAVVLTVENDFSANGQLEITYQSIDKILFRTNLKKNENSFLKLK